METELVRLRSLIDELKELVEGGRNRDVSPGVIGLVKKNQAIIDDIRIRVVVLERHWDRFKWTVAGWATIGAAVGGTLLATWIDNLTGGGTP